MKPKPPKPRNLNSNYFKFNSKAPQNEFELFQAELENNKWSGRGVEFVAVINN